MSKFVGGFAAATLVWGGALAVLHFGLGWGPPHEVIAVDPALEIEAEVEVATEGRIKRRAGRRGARRGALGSPAESSIAIPQGEAITGDDLREGEMRTIDGEGSGGEQQLSGAQIDAAFEAGMGRIRRCFLLAPGEEPITGRLTFGLRIGGSGSVSAVNLSGPAALTTGEPGECLRGAARTIRFPPFDGPEMVVRYPITLE